MKSIFIKTAALLFLLTLVNFSVSAQSQKPKELLAQRDALLQKGKSTRSVDEQLARWGYHFPAQVKSTTVNNQLIFEFESFVGAGMDAKFNESYAKDGIIGLHTDAVSGISTLTMSPQVANDVLKQAFIALGYDGYTIVKTKH